MSYLRRLSARPELLVDQYGVLLRDPLANVIGWNGNVDEQGKLIPVPFVGEVREIWATLLNVGGGLTSRYVPAHPPGESATFGMVFDTVIPAGVGVQWGTVEIATNTVPPVDASADWTVGENGVSVRGRALYARLSGGVAGTDYQITWTAWDTEGNIWPRTGLVLCSNTS
jgi:hypothetical protein